MRLPKVRSMGRQRGLAAVEAVIVMPFLLLLFLGVAELGRALLQYNTLAKSVRDGARHLATYAIDDFTNSVNPSDQLIMEAKRLARYGNISASGETVLPDYTDDHLSIDMPDADHITLIANYPFQPLFNSLPTFGYGNGSISLTFSMETSVTMKAMK